MHSWICHVNPPKGRKRIEVTTTLLILAIVTVYLRFIARRWARLAVGIDEWTLVGALVLVLAIYVEGLVWVLHGGIGKHVTELSLAELTVLFKCYLAYWVTFTATFALSKLSVLLFYAQLSPIRGFRVAYSVVGFLVVALAISICTVEFFQCGPFHFIWDKTIPGGVSYPMTRIFYWTAIPTLFLNATVICLPMPIIWGLQMETTHKITLISVFRWEAFECLLLCAHSRLGFEWV
ncbi:MAG: hypothetical protein Q9179_000381 [Wetmoreana sp. 5 TL-2023]